MNLPSPESSTATIPNGIASPHDFLNREFTVALIGNPNTGKSTLFNRLAGMNAQVGNYPGVTVEKKVGRFHVEKQAITLVDLPGTYSLSPRSADEMVSVNVLLNKQPDLNPLDAVICIVDATHLQRNFYLFSQLLDVGLPLVLVLNMWDEVERQELRIDCQELERRVGVPVVPISARRGKGLDELKSALLRLLQSHSRTSMLRDRLELFPEAFQQARRELAAEVTLQSGQVFPEYLAERLLLDVNGETEREVLAHHQLPPGVLDRKRAWLAEQECPVPAIEPRVRYGWARMVLQGIVIEPKTRPDTRYDQLDWLLTHRFLGPLVFAAIMLLMFQAIYLGAQPLMSSIEYAQGYVADVVVSVMPSGPLRSLIVDGAIAGVGAVVVFLPQIAILFLFIAMLEDCGYMARAAYIMDCVMTKFGLSGKSFVPLMSSYACAIPGIMATRTIENPQDRLANILVAPLMSCSARLPVYILMINAFIPDDTVFGAWLSLRALVLFMFYFVGALVAIPVAWTLKRTWLRGEPAPFAMELPGFKWPGSRVVFARVRDRSAEFLTNAGTLIFVTTILVWAAGYFPGDHTELHRLETRIEQWDLAPDAPELEQLQQDRRDHSTRLLNESFLGQAGHLIEPIVSPLGWDWRIGMAVISSFPAREVVIGTLGTIFSLGGDIDESDTRLMDRLKAARHPDGRPLFNIPVALSVMVFFALCAQCAATLMVMRQETRSWKWPLFSFTYMTTLAYLAALVVYQTGMALGSLN